MFVLCWYPWRLHELTMPLSLDSKCWGQSTLFVCCFFPPINTAADFKRVFCPHGWGRFSEHLQYVLSLWLLQRSPVWSVDWALQFGAALVPQGQCSLLQWQKIKSLNYTNISYRNMSAILSSLRAGWWIRTIHFNINTKLIIIELIQINKTSF